jgi:hypothetical protein
MSLAQFDEVLRIPVFRWTWYGGVVIEKVRIGYVYGVLA